MEYEDHVAAVEQEVARMVAAFGAGPLDVAVPTCPEWTLADLAKHVGGFTGFWANVLCEGTGRPKTPFPPMPEGPDGPEGPDVAGWYRGIAADLVAELRATRPDQATWSWVADRQNAAFVARRAAHELSVHRFDAETARGGAGPIDSAVATDGIDEIFVMIEAWRAQDADASGLGYGRGKGETLHLHATDREAEWMIALDADALRVRHEHAKGDLALRGAVSDLELILYQRPPLGPVERFGEESVLDAWYRAFHFG